MIGVDDIKEGDYKLLWVSLDNNCEICLRLSKDGHVRFKIGEMLEELVENYKNDDGTFVPETSDDMEAVARHLEFEASRLRGYYKARLRGWQ